MNLRQVTAPDLPAVAALQIASWRRAYRGHLPDAFLESEVVDVLNDRWAAHPGSDWWIEGAWDGDTLLGFCALERSHDGGPYVDNLHVAAAAQGRGVGRALMASAGRAMADERRPLVWLTVMQGNAGARGFYAAIGGQEGAVKHHALYGQPVSSLPVHWHDLAALGRVG